MLLLGRQPLLLKEERSEMGSVSKAVSHEDRGVEGNTGILEILDEKAKTGKRDIWEMGSHVLGRKISAY